LTLFDAGAPSLTRTLRQGWDSTRASPVLVVVLAVVFAFAVAFLSVIPAGNLLFPLWQPRYYDFNVYTAARTVEKLKYLHRNPVRRGLVEKPEDWRWSSCRYYATGQEGTVEIESGWTSWKREQKAKTSN
jgi:hypothetical protein